MKHILTLLLITLTTITSNAKIPTKSEKKTEAVIYDADIPKDVQKWLKKELKNTTTSVLESFETPAFFTTKNAKIIGYIKGYDKTLGAKTGMFYYDNDITNENKPRVIEIHEDGRFELEIPLDYPTQDYFVIKNQIINFYLEPGQNLSIILNWEDLKQTKTISYPLKRVTYQGALGNINTNLLHYKPNYSPNDIQEKESIMEPLPFKKDMLEFKTNALNKIKAYEQSGKLDKKTSELLKNEIILETYYSLFDYYSPTYSSYYGQGKRKNNNIDDKVPDDYYDFIKDLPLNKQSILVSSGFSSFINRLEFTPLLDYKPKFKKTSTADDFKGFSNFIEKKNIEITTEEKRFFDDIKNDKLKNKEVISIKLGNFYKKHESLVKEYLEIISEIHYKNRFKSNWKGQDSLASNLGIKNNLFYEIIKVRSLKLKLKYREDKTWYWSELKKGIKSPYLLVLGDKLLENEISKPEFYELPDNEKGSLIFKKIIAPYEGKAVVIQFWMPSTYYRGDNLERTKNERNNHKNNNNIVFLFITNKNSSSLEEYKASVIKNGFENSMRIPQDDYHYLRQLFKFNNSIKNIIVTKDGKIISKDF